MSEFKSIEIDFDIHKLIEAERQNFTETPTTILRRLLKLKSVNSQGITKRQTRMHAWSGKGVTLPHGTKLQMKYLQRQYFGEVVDGKWVIDGKVFDSPSGAASGIATTRSGQSTNLDGWKYWKALLPGEISWKAISRIRQKISMTPDELGL